MKNYIHGVSWDDVDADPVYQEGDTSVDTVVGEFWERGERYRVYRMADGTHYWRLNEGMPRSIRGVCGDCWGDLYDLLLRCGHPEARAIEDLRIAEGK